MQLRTIKTFTCRRAPPTSLTRSCGATGSSAYTFSVVTVSLETVLYYVQCSFCCNTEHCRFVNLLTFKHSAAEYKIDYSAFNAVYKCDLSPLSQKIKEEEQEEVEGEEEVGEVESDEETKEPSRNVEAGRINEEDDYFSNQECTPNK